MRGLAVPTAFVLAVGLLPVDPSVVEGLEPAVECRNLLDRTLAEMKARPTLKEEFATGVMWVRLDALKALQAGDVETCLERARRVAALVKVD